MKKTNFLMFIILLLSSCSSNISSDDSNYSSQEQSSLNSDTISSEESSSIYEESSSIYEESSSNAQDSPSQEETPSKSKARNVSNFISSEGDIPLINIYTNDNSIINSKEIYTPGYLNIVEQPNYNNIILDNTTMGIRLRGNSTIACPKKAYRIKFDKKTSLFDLPAAKSWVLLANYYDKTNLRNYLAYLTANKLDNLEFQPSSIMVEVNVNNEYQGLYLLCEQMQTGKGRVDIEKKKDENGNSSFLLELDDYQRLIDEGEKLDETFIGVDEKYYKIKYPEGEDLTASQIKFIKDIMTQYRHSLKERSSNLDSIIDVDSFIDSYFVEELFKNVDGDFTSMYYYWEPDSKITAGPVWDFDIGLNVVGLNDTDNAYYDYHYSSLWMLDRKSDYYYLNSNRNYYHKFVTRFKEIKDLLYENFNEITLAKKHLKNAQERNINKWSVPGDLSTWIAQRYDRNYVKLTTLDEYYTHLEQSLQIQFDNLEDYYR